MVYSGLCLHPWIDGAPSCAEARPACCPSCAAASLPPGKPFVVVGRGHRDRQVLGPSGPNGDPEWLRVGTHRFRCRACEAVFVVVPRGILRRRWYSGIAIAQALARVVLLGQSGAEVRAAISPFALLGDSARRGWKQLGVWLAAAPQLFWLPRPAANVEGVLGQLASLALGRDSASPIERIVAGVVSIGSE